MDSIKITYTVTSTGWTRSVEYRERTYSETYKKIPHGYETTGTSIGFQTGLPKRIREQIEGSSFDPEDLANVMM